MSSKIQLRRGTAANWTSANPTLAQGEIGYETDTGYIKIGDGTTAWTSLAYAKNPDLVAATSSGTANTLAKRDSNGGFNVGWLALTMAQQTSATSATRKDYVDGQDATFRRRGTLTQFTANYTLALTDEGTEIYGNSSSALTVTIPTNATVPFVKGSWIDISQTGSGQVTISPAAGVTLQSPNGSTTLRAQYSTVRLYNNGGDSWQLSGDVTTPADSTVTSATSVSTANTLVKRDANGRASVADPSASTDISTKNYVDTKTWTSSQISDAASASTANVVMKRDAAGRASVADPSASTDISTKNYTDTQDATMRRPGVNTQTVSYTLVLTDERKIVQMNSASAITLTIPLNSSVAFPVGTVIDVQQLGAGVVTLSPTAGVTMNLPDNLSTLNRQYSVVRLQKVGTDTWNVSHIGAANATSVSTASTFMKRDASGRASVADPSASTDIATKNYIDTKLPGKVSVGTVAPSTPSTNDIWIDTN